MIKSFKDRETEKVFHREFSPKLPPEIQRKAYKKLLGLHFAKAIHELMVPRSNHLKELKGKRAGQYSMRINNQWRICFIWIGENAYNVEIIDYH